MEILSNLAASIPANTILAFNNQIKEQIRAGASIHNFTIGDFDPQIFPIPQALESGIIAAYKNNKTNYPTAEGNIELRSAISNFVANKLTVEYKPSNILVAAGGRPLIYAAYQVIVDAGDKVIFPVPSWNNHYYSAFTQANVCMIETKAEDSFMLTAALLKPHIKDAVLLALCSPQNPTGTCYTSRQLKEICELVIAENKRRAPGQKKLYVLYDQMYNLLTYGNTTHAHPVELYPEMRNYTIYIDAISKSFAATGVRVGWAYGPEAVIRKMKVVLTHVGAWAPMAEQVAVASFLENTNAVEQFLFTFKTALKKRLQLLYNGIQQMKAEGLPVDAIAPDASIYLSFKINIDSDMMPVLLKESGVAVLSFSLFGARQAANWYRISVGTSRLEEIPLVIEKIKHVIELEVAPAVSI